MYLVFGIRLIFGIRLVLIKIGIECVLVFGIECIRLILVFDVYSIGIR